MQPAVADRVHSWTVPASTATTRVRRAAIRAFPWWLPPGRGSPKSSEKLVFPTTGNTIRAGDAECATAARDCCAPASATRTRVAATRRVRAVVRGKGISGGARKRFKATKVCGAQAPPTRRGPTTALSGSLTPPSPSADQLTPRGAHETRPRNRRLDFGRAAKAGRRNGSHRRGDCGRERSRFRRPDGGSGAGAGTDAPLRGHEERHLLVRDEPAL